MKCFHASHGSLGKGVATFMQEVELADGSVVRLYHLLAGRTPTLPPAPDGDAYCHYRDVNGSWILASPPTGPYMKGRSRFDSSRHVVISSHQSWTQQVFNAASEYTYAYTDTLHGKKITHKRFRTITPGMLVVDEAHTCSKSGAGHYGIIDY